jgi:hypothetical protein
MESTAKSGRVFVSFQGGGAKGIVHIGGLRAIELSNLDMLARLLDTVVNGPVKIHSQGISGLILVPLPTSLKMLGFSASRARYTKEVRVSCRRAFAVLDDQVNLRVAVSSLLSELADQLLKAWDVGPEAGISPVISLYLQRVNEHQVIRLVSRNAEIGELTDLPLPFNKSIYHLTWQLDRTSFVAPKQHWRDRVPGCDWFLITPLKGGGAGERALLLTVQVPDLPAASITPTLTNTGEFENIFRALVLEFDRVNQLGRLARGSQVWN